MAKKTVALLFGGVSSEYDVSCLSVSSVFENVDRKKYNPVLIGITKEGEWYLYEGDIEKVRAHEWDKDTENLKKSLDNSVLAVKEIMLRGTDSAMNKYNGTD